MTDYRWHVVHTKSREEDRANFHLMDQDFKTYLPKYERSAGRNGIPRVVPLFPGYLFVWLNPEVCPWYHINNSRGVNYILTDADGRPQAISDDVVTAIKDREIVQGDVALISMDPEAWSELDAQEGDEVTVTGGPFLGHKAIFKCHLDRDRVSLLMEIMGSKATEVVAAVEDVRVG